MEAAVGSVVYSRAGRDKGNFFVIIMLDGEYAYVCDGDLRRSEKPKKKKLKHLKVTNTVCQSVAEKMAEAGRVTNAELRRVLAEFCELSGEN